MATAVAPHTAASTKPRCPPGMLKVRVRSVLHLEGLFERLGEHGEMHSYVVLFTR
ncbi:hypothetical protein ACWDKQ_19510 [Saccharopolyspora sp. NPDC000995]